MKHWSWFVVLMFTCLSLQAIEYKSFDESMPCADKNNVFCRFMFRHHDSEKIYNAYKNLFENSFKQKPMEQSIIPKKLHYAWIGDKKMPKIYQDYIETCRAVNPDWEITVWDEQVLAKEFPQDDPILVKIRSLKIPKPFEKDYYLFKVLDKYGGIFLDLDYVCLQSFNELTNQYTNFFVLEPPAYWSKIAYLSLSMVGANAGSKLLKQAYKNWGDYYLSKEYVDAVSQYFEKGVFFNLLGYVYYDFAQTAAGLGLIQYCQTHNCERVSVFPPTYFNPIFLNNFNMGVNTVRNLGFYDRLKYVMFGYSLQYPYTQIYPETIAVQDWHEDVNLLNLYNRRK